MFAYVYNGQIWTYLNQNFLILHNSPKTPKTTSKTLQNSKNFLKTPIFRRKLFVVFHHFKANYESHMAPNVL